MCQAWLRVLLSCADTPGAFRSSQEAVCVICVYVCMCASCASVSHRQCDRKKPQRIREGTTTSNSFRCSVPTWNGPRFQGRMRVSFCILYPPQLQFAFSVADFSLRMSSSLAQGFLKCLSAVLEYSHRNTRAQQICVQSTSRRFCLDQQTYESFAAKCSKPWQI